MLKSGKEPEKLKVILEKLTRREALDRKHHDHKLQGPFHYRRECHIEPDWLLVYKLTDEEIIFERNGTHADLFE